MSLITGVALQVCCRETPNISLLLKSNSIVINLFLFHLALEGEFDLVGVLNRECQSLEMVLLKI